MRLFGKGGGGGGERGGGVNVTQRINQEIQIPLGQKRRTRSSSNVVDSFSFVKLSSLTRLELGKNW